MLTRTYRGRRRKGEQERECRWRIHRLRIRTGRALAALAALAAGDVVVRGKNVPSFLWTIHFEGINYAFSFHCAWVVGCQLSPCILFPCSTPLPRIVTPLCSHKSLTRFCAKSFRACRRKQSPRVVWQSGRQPGRVCPPPLLPPPPHPTHTHTLLHQGPRSVINLICNEAFLKFILFVLLEYARVCVWAGLRGLDP